MVREEINAAYWLFTMCARAVPPSMAVPASYRDKRLIMAETREMWARERLQTAAP